MSHRKPAHVALLSKSDRITYPWLQDAAKVLQQYVDEHVAPAWNEPAIVTAYEHGGDVFPGSWPFTVEDNIGAPGAAGFHSDHLHQPYAEIESEGDVLFVMSHELVETLVDRSGNRLYHAPDPSIPFGSGNPRPEVRVLLEVADPSEAPENGITVAGHLLADFYLPAYERNSTHGPFSASGRIQHALQVLEGGYISYADADDVWKQFSWLDGAGPKTTVLGMYGQDEADLKLSLREWVDLKTHHARKVLSRHVAS